MEKIVRETEEEIRSDIPENIKEDRRELIKDIQKVIKVIEEAENDETSPPVADSGSLGDKRDEPTQEKDTKRYTLMGIADNLVGTGVRLLKVVVCCLVLIAIVGLGAFFGWFGW